MWHSRNKTKGKKRERETNQETDYREQTESYQRGCGQREGEQVKQVMGITEYTYHKH